MDCKSIGSKYGMCVYMHAVCVCVCVHACLLVCTCESYFFVLLVSQCVSVSVTKENP